MERVKILIFNLLMRVSLQNLKATLVSDKVCLDPTYCDIFKNIILLKLDLPFSKNDTFI